MYSTGYEEAGYGFIGETESIIQSVEKEMGMGLGFDERCGPGILLNPLNGQHRMKQSVNVPYQMGCFHGP